MNHEEVAEITEREIEKFNNLNNFARFIDLNTFYYFFSSQRSMSTYSL